MAHRPVIGLSTYSAVAEWGVWHTNATLLPDAYLDALLDAGSSPVLLPPGTDTDDVLGRVDGIVLVGGPDVDPSRYGAERVATTQPSHAGRDEFELELAVATPRLGLPLLAICRGMQIVNVARGGTLHQHLPDIVGHDGHSPGPGLYGATTVHIEAGTTTARILGQSTVTVDCYHHQGLDRLGDGLVVSARAEDGVIEAVEDPSARFLVVVQWHPEAGTDPSLFTALLDATAHRSS